MAKELEKLTGNSPQRKKKKGDGGVSPTNVSDGLGESSRDRQGETPKRGKSIKGEKSKKRWGRFRCRQKS